MSGFYNGYPNTKPFEYRTIQQPNANQASEYRTGLVFGSWLYFFWISFLLLVYIRGIFYTSFMEKFKNDVSKFLEIYINTIAKLSFTHLLDFTVQNLQNSPPPGANIIN
jgi:hypothetical protein